MREILLTGALCLLTLSGGFRPTAAEEIELGDITVTDTQDTAPFSEEFDAAAQSKKSTPGDGGELLKTLPEISTRRTGSRGLDPILRGMKGDQLNILIDGARVWGACPGRMDPPPSLLDPGEVETVELVKGPFALHHPGGALGGVLNLKTRETPLYEEFNFHGKASLGLGEASDGKEGGLAFYGGDRGYNFRLSCNSRYANDYDTPAGNVTPSGADDYSFSAKGSLVFNKENRLSVSLLRNVGKDRGYPARVMDSEKDRTQLWNIHYAVRDISPALIALEGRLFYNKVKHVMNNAKRRAAMFMETKSRADTLGGKVEAVFAAGDESSLSCGADFYRLARDAERTRVMPMTVIDKPWDKARVLDVGLYCSWEGELFPRYRLQASARADLVRADSNLKDPAFMAQNNTSDLRREETNLSANITLACRLNDHLKLLAGVGRGSRSADTNERYSNNSTTSPYMDGFTYLGDPDLEPEKSLEADLGAEASFTEGRVRATLFCNRVDDYISARRDPALGPAAKRYTNIDALLMGFEISGAYNLSRRLTLQGGAAYTRGENRDTRDPLPQIPPFSGRGGLQYREGSFWGEGTVRFAAGQKKIDPSFGETPTGGYTVCDLVFGADLECGLSLTAGVENLFDKKFSDHLNGMDNTSGDKLFEPGRNLFAKAQWEF